MQVSHDSKLEDKNTAWDYPYAQKIDQDHKLNLP